MEFINSAKRTFVNNKGWKIILMGLLISILGTIVAFPVAKLLGLIIKPFVGFLDYDIRKHFIALPNTILTNAVAGIAISFIVSNLIYMAKNQATECSIEDRIAIAMTFVTKYIKEIAIFLILPKVILELVTGITVAIAAQKILGGGIVSMLMTFSSPLKYWFITVGLVVLFGGISLLVNFICSIKFISCLDEINVNVDMIRKLYTLSIIASVSYVIVSLIPILGVLASIFIVYGCYALIGSVIIVSAENSYTSNF